MSIRAKMRCHSVTDGGDPKYSEQIELGAVYGDGTENASFAKATPSASLKMQIDNPGAFGAFVPGAEYYVDFTPADAPAVPAAQDPVPEATPAAAEAEAPATPPAEAAAE